MQTVVKKERIKRHEETRREYMKLDMALEKQSQETRMAIAVDMLKDNIPKEKIVKYTKLSLEIINELAKKA